MMFCSRRAIFYGVGVTLALFSDVVTQTANAQTGPSSFVGVAVALEPGKINAPTVELYREVELQVGTSAAWRLINAAEFAKGFRTDSRFGSLGSIVAIPRQEVAHALEASKAHKNGKNTAVLIPSVQAALDTMALDGAIIVDCDPEGVARVKECQVLFYDRVQGKIQAAASKDFRVPISDASRWASMLVTNLSSGMQSYKLNKEKAKLQEFLQASAQEEEGRMSVSIGAGGRNIRDSADAGLRNLAGVSVGFGYQKPSYLVNVLGAFYSGNKSDGGVSRKATVAGGGLGLDLRSPALEAMYWTLGISGMYEQVSVSQGEGSQKDVGLGISVGPGLMWTVGGDWSIGADVSYRHYVALNQNRTGTFETDAVNISGLGVGLRLRYEL